MAGIMLMVLAAVCVMAVNSLAPPQAPPPGPVLGPGGIPPIEFWECPSGFSVRKAVGRTRQALNVVRFQDVLTNRGAWSQSDSKFIAPCPGTYFFTFHAQSSETQDFTLALMKNGVYQVTAYGSKNGYQQGSNSALLQLETGDEVYLYLQQGELYEHPHDESYTTFSGHLVEKIRPEF
ncbi:complement C1q-like protein 4 [Homarus americanus]|uniref:complement C1q-like protein 4 n=1 Tax=Homarus americanus TaxID=6706 RepID=UPI001C471227|nr:complement C1q-like protein 4 [Homarus americanus]